jgi:shikimate kinase
MTTNIFLIGMPSSGKSTLGRQIAKSLGYEFIDLDIRIEIAEGKKIAEILPLTTQTGKIELKFRKGDNINNGIYLLKIKSNEQIVNKKVIFAN